MESYLKLNQRVLLFGAYTGICLFIAALNIRSHTAAYKYSWMAGLGINMSLFFLSAQLRIYLSLILVIVMLGIVAFQIFKYIYGKY